MDTKLRKEAKNEFEKDFFKLMNNSVFGKTMENVRNQRDIKLVTSDKRRKRLVSEPNYHPHKKLSEYLMAMKMKKTNVKIKKPIYLGMSMLYISETLMYEFCYDYIKPKFGHRAKLCYVDTDSLTLHIITEDFYEDIANGVERWFDTSNYEENGKIPLQIGKKKKVTGLFKDELEGKIMTEFVVIRPKIWGYLIDGYDNDNYGKNKIINKKAKGTKECAIKRRTMFKNYKDCLMIKPY